MGNGKTVGDLLAELSYELDPPAVSWDGSLRDVVRAIVKGFRWRIVYVIGPDRTLKGAISLDILKDTIFRCYLDGRVSDATIMSDYIVDLFASEKAGDIMDLTPLFCHKDEQLDEVVAKMIEHDIKDMPVVDGQKRLIANVDILDLFDFWLREGENIC